MKELKAKAKSQGGNIKAMAGAHRARGGGNHGHTGKAGTKVNVIVAPRAGGPVTPGVDGGAAGPAPVMPSRPVRPAAPSLAGLAGPGAGGLKRGGRAHRADGGKVGKFDAGAGSGEGRLEKEAHERKRGK